jgi:hypothetical protein
VPRRPVLEVVPVVPVVPEVPAVPVVPVVVPVLATGVLVPRRLVPPRRLCGMAIPVTALTRMLVSTMCLGRLPMGGKISKVGRDQQMGIVLIIASQSCMRACLCVVSGVS